MCEHCNMTSGSRVIYSLRFGLYNIYRETYILVTKLLVYNTHKTVKSNYTPKGYYIYPKIPRATYNYLTSHFACSV